MFYKMCLNNHDIVAPVHFLLLVQRLITFLSVWELGTYQKLFNKNKNKNNGLEMSYILYQLGSAQMSLYT